MSRLIAVFALLAVSFVSMRVAIAADWAPKDPPEIYPMNAGPNAVRRNDVITDICKTETQLDCLESVEAFLNGAWVKGVTDEKLLSWGGYIWSIEGLKNLNGSNFVNSYTQLSYTGNVFLNTTLSSPDSGDSDGNGLQRDVKFRVTMRSSWVLPTHVSGKVTEGKIVVEKLPQSGASRVSMEGIPMLYLIVNNQASLSNPLSKGDNDVRYFVMSVSDGRFFPMKKDCIEKPTMFIADNAYGPSILSFAEGNLDLKVVAPHFRKDGVTVHRGVYDAIIPIETALCLWGGETPDTSQFKVEVFESSTGESKTSTFSVALEENAIRIKVSGFTFSEPTIRVTYGKTAVPIASKPMDVKLSLKRGAISTTFTRVTGTTYTAVATTKGARKRLKCTAKKTKITCATKGLKKGQWKLTVTPSIKKVKGTPFVKTVRIR